MKINPPLPDALSSLPIPAAALCQACRPNSTLLGYFPQSSVKPAPYLYLSACFRIEETYPYRISLPADPRSGEAPAYCLIYTESGQGSISLRPESPSAALPPQPEDLPVALSPRPESPPETILLPQQTYFFWPCSQACLLRAVSSHWNHLLLFLSGKEASYFYQLYKEKGPRPWPVPANSRFPALLSNLARTDPSSFASPMQQLFLTTSLMTKALSLCPDAASQEAFCPSYLLAIRRMLDEEYALPCSLDLLEKRFRVSKYRIAREFSQYFHQAPISYLNQRRLEAAKNLLITTDNKIHEISQKTGFGNPNLFIRSFKKEFGVTPQIYRKENSKIRL